MSGKTRAKQAIERLDINKKNVEYLISGILGLTIGGEKAVEVPGRPGYHYVRLRDNLSEVVHAYNSETSPVYGLPVLITKDATDNTKYVVVGRDTERYQNWGSSAFIPRHGAQHSFDKRNGAGGDIVWVYGDQFMPLNVTPSGSSASQGVLVYDYVWWHENQWNYISLTGTSSLLGYKPTTADQARFVLVYLDPSTGDLGYSSGSEFAASVTGTPAVYAYLPDIPSSNYIPIYAVRLVTGTSVVTWDNLYDVRPYFTGGGAGSTGTVFGGFTQGSVPFGDSGGGLTEDNAKFFFDDTNDRLIVGDNALPYSSSSQIAASKDGGAGGFNAHSYGSIPIYAAFSSAGSKASPTASTQGSSLLWISAGGYDGTSWLGLRAAIRMYAAELWSSSGRGTYMDILLTTTGSTGGGVTEQIWRNLHNFSGDIQVTGTVHASLVESEDYSVGGQGGASGNFTTVDGKTVTVVNGIITSIV